MTPASSLFGMTAGLHLRRAGPDDQPAIIDLLVETMGWLPGGAAQRVFEWKHITNSFGESPMWVACTEADRIVALRTFMRWEFVNSSGAVLRAVRAVDTVTHPEFRGGGLFRTMTLQAVEELTADGVEFVFNTPNDQSRPGYLKMGWVPVERVPVRLSPLRPSRALTIARSIRMPADLDPDPDVPAVGAPIDDAALARFEGGRGSAAGLATHSTMRHLRWRYAESPYRYRAVVNPDGAAIIRLRRRGGALEATIAELRATAPLRFERHLRRSLKVAGVTFASRVGNDPKLGVRWLNAQRFGPLLVRRPLNNTTEHRFALSAGDVEIF
jgi:Acetyltransferase (GNAT) domain